MMMSDQQHRRQPQRLCQECKNDNNNPNRETPRPALYQCPRCSHLTCSLACCLAHKARLKCDGKRDKTKFVPVSHMTDSTLRSDYHFLEDIVETVDKGQRLLRQVEASVGRAGHQSKNKRPRPDEGTEETTKEEEPPHTLLQAAEALALSPPSKRRIVVSPQLLQPQATGSNIQQQQQQQHQQHIPPRWRTFQKLAAERSTTVLFMPSGMARHQSNKSHVKKGDTLHWTIEWCFHRNDTNDGLSEMKPMVATSTTPTTTTKATLTTETAVVGDVLQTLLKERNGESAQTIADYSILLKKLPRPSNQPLYIEIAATATVREALQHATVYEYPTFHIVSNNSRAAQFHFPRLIVEMKDGENSKEC